MASLPIFLWVIKRLMQQRIIMHIRINLPVCQELNQKRKTTIFPFNKGGYGGGIIKYKILAWDLLSWF